MPERPAQELEGRGLWLVVAGAAGLTAVLFALVAGLRAVAPDAVRAGRESWAVEVWTGVAAFAFLISSGIAARRQWRQAASPLPLACLLFVSLCWLAFVRHCGLGVPNHDFLCYYEAGRAVRHGANIFDPAALNNHAYIYSPALAGLFSAVELLPAEQAERVSYWVWNALNFWAVPVFFLLLTAVLRRYGVSGPGVWIGVSAAMVCNVPLQRTLLMSQLNLHVMNLIFVSLLWQRKRPGTAGGVLGFAAVLKSSPALLVAPFAAAKRWRAVAGVALGVAALMAASVGISGLRPWLDFVRSWQAMHSLGHYRDNSFQSLLIGLGRLGGVPADSKPLLLAGTVLAVAAAGLLIALALRPRYQALFAGERADLPVEGALPLCLAAMVIASPRIWEHHWIFLQLPFCLLAARAWNTRFMIPALLCFGLVFAVPTFDIYLLSYHRLAGLVWWVVLVQRMAAAAEEVKPRRRRRKAAIGVA